MENTYQLIALDMDGTLLAPDKTIQPETARDIRLAASRGVHIVYCTGRAMPELRDYFGVVPEMRYAVCNSGACVYDREEDRCLYSSVIPYKMADTALAAARRYGAMLQFLTERESIVASADVTHMADFHMGIYQPMFERLARTVADMARESERLEAIAKINLYFRSPEDRLRCYEEMCALPLVDIALPEATTLEMTARNVSKASGLAWLAGWLGIPMARVAGVGDSDNDREMLRSVGLSFAMGNAEPGIRALCDLITADNAHNGAGEAIRRTLTL